MFALVALAALSVFGPLAQTAKADLPPGAGCPATPGSGTTAYMVTATLPAGAGQNANGVCINCTGTGGENNSAALVANAAGCVAAPTVGAGSSYIWADWGSNNCVVPGNSVKIRFRGIALAPPEVYTVTWRLADGSTFAGTGTVSAPVGGVAEITALDMGAAELAEEGGGLSTGRYAAMAAGAVVAALVLSAGVVYARRRRLS
jgi:hypothetical protein